MDKTIKLIECKASLFEEKINTLLKEGWLPHFETFAGWTNSEQDRCCRIIMEKKQ